MNTSELSKDNKIYTTEFTGGERSEIKYHCEKYKWSHKELNLFLFPMKMKY